jgi:endoglucanase
MHTITQVFWILIILCTTLTGTAQLGTYQPLIAVNQYGYLPDAQKIAVIAHPQIGYNSEVSYDPPASFQVRESGTNDLLLEVEATPWNGGTVHAQSGDQIWWVDFSSISTPGSYYLYDADNGYRSAVFEIDPCVYGEVLRHGIRAFYYQRCGTPKAMSFAATPWTDASCHLHPSQDSDCRLYNNNDPSTSRELSGGWHDAGDYNKYVNFTFEPLLDLCDAYSFYGLWDDDLQLPESGNGVPDVLDEVNYELMWLSKMQNSDGSVHCMVGAQTYDSNSPPSTDLTTRVYGPTTTAATYSTAAVFARASLVMPEFLVAEYLPRAIDAWNWANAHPDITFYNSGIIVSGEQEPSAYETWSRRLTAAIYLFAATGDVTYRTVIENEYLQAHLMQWSFVYPFESALQNALLYYAHNVDPIDPVAEEIKSTYLQSVTTWNEDLMPAVVNQTDAYRAYLSDQNYTWGSNTTKARLSHIYQNMRHYGMDPDNDWLYTQASQGVIDYFSGVNPNQVCFQTNMSASGAEQSCNSIYHGWFHDGSNQWDEVGVSTYGPAPGFVPGGVNPTYSLDACCLSDCGSAGANALCDATQVTPPLNQPVQKSWRDWNTSWPQNSWTVTEIGIYTQAAFIKMLASLTASECLSPTYLAENIKSSAPYFQIHPNPNDHSVVHLSSSVLPFTGPFEIQIFDLGGRQCSSETSRTQEGRINCVIDTQNLIAGCYLVQVIFPEGTLTQRLMRL